jgi:hypothetical protein
MKDQRFRPAEGIKGRDSDETLVAGLLLDDALTGSCREPVKLTSLPVADFWQPVAEATR